MTQQTEFELADLRVKPGAVGFTRVPVTGLLTGTILAIPVHVIHGAEPGPAVGITSAVHGVEHLPIRMVKGALARLDPGDLRGTIVAVPVCNPLSFAKGTRVTPDEDDVDFTNLNRVFPGRRKQAVFGMGQPPPSDRTLTEALAAIISEEIVPRITHLIDFHCHTQGAGLIKTIQKKGGEGQMREVALGMCRALGLGLIHEHADDERTLTGHAATKGVPACVPEIGGGGLAATAEARAVALGVRGILNVLKFLDMIDGRVEVPSRQLLFEVAPHVRPTTAGYLVSCFDPDQLFLGEEMGVPVKKGEVLGQLFDPYTFESLETLSSPVDGILYITRRSGPVEAGSHAYAVADFDMSRWID